MNDLIAFLRACLDNDERVAREASRATHGDGWTATGEHWQWEETEHDQALTLDPMLDEYLNDGGQVALRSAEQYPTGNRWDLPHFVVSSAEEVRTVDAMHIARWDPARVLAEIAAKRALLEEAIRPYLGAETTAGRVAVVALSLLAQPYAGRDGWREEWRAEQR